MNTVRSTLNRIDLAIHQAFSRPINVWNFLKVHFVAIEKITFLAVACYLGTYQGNALVPVMRFAVGIALLDSLPVKRIIKKILGDNEKYEPLRNWIESPALKEGWKVGCLFRGVFRLTEGYAYSKPSSIIKGVFWITWSSVYSNWI